MAYDSGQFNLLTEAVKQTQAKILWYNTLAQQNPQAAGMYQAAVQQEQQRLASYQQALGQQQATPPINEAGYAQQKSDVGQQYGAQLAANDYSRTIAQQRHAREAGDFNVAASRQRNSFDSPYLQRGLFRSGVRDRGLTEMRQSQTSAYGNLVGTQAAELGQLGQQRTQLQANRQSALNAVDRARQQAIHEQLLRLGG